MSVLSDPAFIVPPQPAASSGVAWLRANVVRFSEGAEHARRRRLTEELLAGIDTDSLRRAGSPTANLAAALALGRDEAIVDDVAVIARSYQPHNPQTDAADAAVARMVARFGGAWNEASAARICLLVQAHDATLASIAGLSPPVPATRRIAPNGDEVIVDLAATPFGAGRHECPGRLHALAMIDGAAGSAPMRDQASTTPE